MAVLCSAVSEPAEGARLNCQASLLRIHKQLSKLKGAVNFERSRKCTENLKYLPNRRKRPNEWGNIFSSVLKGIKTEVMLLASIPVHHSSTKPR